MAEPPRVPGDFWATDQMRDALAAQHIGRICRAYRKHPYHIASYGRNGIPQGVVARWLGITQAQISRIENGSAVKHLDSLAQWARTLRIPEDLLWFKLHNAVPTKSTEVGRPSDHALARPTTARAHFVTRLSAIVPPPIPTSADDHDLSAAMQSFRMADRHIGGGHLYASVVRYLQTVVGPRLFGMGDQVGGRRVFNAAAALTEMAGWMAHDAGRDPDAKRHFSRALDLAAVSGDRQVHVHLMASLSHLALHGGRPAEAVRFAQQGLAALSRGPRIPELIARLTAMQARGYAGLRQPDQCTKLLAGAENALTHVADEEMSPWVSHFDEASLAGETARCLQQIGDLEGARRQAERVIARRPADRARSRAFGQLTLVTVLIAQGELDEACAIANQVLAATRQISSYLVIKEVVGLRQKFDEHRGTPVVGEFLDCLDDALHERHWLSLRGSRGGWREAAGRGEV